MDKKIKETNIKLKELEDKLRDKEDLINELERTKYEKMLEFKLLKSLIDMLGYQITSNKSVRTKLYHQIYNLRDSNEDSNILVFDD